MTQATADIIIQNATVLTVNAGDEVIADGAVAIADGRILAVGPSSEIDARYTAPALIDAWGGVVHPGFIDAHIHVSQYTARSVLARMEGSKVTMGDWKAALRPEDEQASASLAALDCLACGTTGFVDPGTIFEPDAVAEVAGKTGIRIWLTDPYVADLAHALAASNPELVSPGFLARWPNSLDAAAARVGRQLSRNADPYGLVRGFVATYGEATASSELRAHALSVARRAGVQYQEHLGYNPAAYMRESDALGRSPLKDFAERHGLDAGVSLTHMNCVDDSDAALLAEMKARLIWCPYGTLQALGSGLAKSRMVELARRGVPVATATDIPRVVDFDGLGGLTAACAAAIGQPIRPGELLRMRTIGAAASVGADGLTGSLEPGKSADLVIRHPRGETLAVDPVWETAVLGSRDSVRAVMVAGRIRFEDGAYPDLDPHAVRRAAHASAMRLAERAGLR